jgi:tRNA threonylcarbamoyladenosine biosynthesis protein TsaE
MAAMAPVRAGIIAPMASREFLTRSPDATRDLAAALGRRLSGGTLVLLEGALGAGKTTFAQGLARGMGTVGRVTSPSFTLVREYATASGSAFVHADLYRLAQDGAAELALEEALDDGAVVAVEWPERAGPIDAPDLVLVELAAADGGRRIRLTGSGRAQEAVAGLEAPQEAET